MNRNQLRSSVIAGAAASVLLLGTGVPAYAAAPAEDQPVQTCSDMTGEQAVAEWGPSLPQDGGLDPQLEYADTTGYDPCAELSWIVVPYGGTASSGNAVMLFHHGEYLGTATAEPQAFTPSIERINDSSIAITYRYLKGDEANARPEGRALSTFTWNDETQSIDHEGDFPPDA